LGAIQDFRQAVRLYAAANLIKEVQNSLNQLRELGVTE
jgi:hypothetical protein